MNFFDIFLYVRFIKFDKINKYSIILHILILHEATNKVNKINVCALSMYDLSKQLDFPFSSLAFKGGLAGICALIVGLFLLVVIELVENVIVVFLFIVLLEQILGQRLMHLLAAQILVHAGDPMGLDQLGGAVDQAHGPTAHPLLPQHVLLHEAFLLFASEAHELLFGLL